MNKRVLGCPHRLVALFMALSIASLAQATNFYVATNGSDSNPGTEAAPWRSIATAAKRMWPGDTTYVKGGTYSEAGVRFERSGSASAPIRLLSAPGETPVISCKPSSYDTRHVVLFQQATGYKNPIGWITMEGFEIRNCWHGITIYNGHDIVIRRNWIHENLEQGILGNGRNVVIDQNRISRNGNFAGCASGKKNKYGTSYCALDHGLYMAGSELRITNNIFDSNLSYGITMNGSGSSQYDANKHAGPDFAGARDWLIANNTFANQHHGAGIVVWGAGCRGSKIINNIFHENSLKRPGANGISLYASSPASGLFIRNNISYSSRGISFLSDSYRSHQEGVHYFQSANAVNRESPRFTNAAAGDFSLQAGSPAIDRGLTLTTEVRHDFVGRKRPQGGAYDIGAHEFTAKGARRPGTPTEIRVR